MTKLDELIQELCPGLGLRWKNCRPICNDMNSVAAFSSDGAKYLHRAFERWAAVEIDDVNPYIFEDPEKSEWHNSSECQGTVLLAFFQ